MKSYALIIMKPDALKSKLIETIMQRFIDEEFQIAMVGFKQVDQELILTHYAHVVDKFGESFRQMVIAGFVGKNMMPIILSQDGEKAIDNARALTGATDPSLSPKGTIRGDYGIDSMEAANRENRCCDNLIHCSDSQQSFLTELKLWFNPKTYKTYAC